MGSNTKKALFVTVTGVVLFAALMNFSAVTAYANKLINLILPVIVGAIMALFLIVPMNGIQKRLEKLFSKAQKRPSKKALCVWSFVITLVCVAVVLAAVLVLLIPEITSSVKALYTQIEASIKNLSKQHFDIKWVEDLVKKINFQAILDNFTGIVNKLTTGADFIFVNVINVFSSTINILVTALFAIIIAAYAALEKSNVARHGKILICAYLKPEWAKGVLKFCRKFSEIFSKFLFGQCSEALILGVMIFIAYSIFNMPYAILASVLTAVCALIPYVGALISCAISVFLTLLVAPDKALYCLIIYLGVQFIETQLIYPRVVGTAVGLSPLYTLVAALIGGNLLGIVGIIFFIPLFAVILELVKENANAKIEKKLADGDLSPEDLEAPKAEDPEPKKAPKPEKQKKEKKPKPAKVKKEKPKQEEENQE